MKSKERRYIIGAEMRVKGGSGDADPMRIEGYAAVFNTESHDLGGFIERVKPGAFSRAITGKQDVRALVNHDPSAVLGRTKSGTLRVWEDEKGLRFSVELPNTQTARDLYESVRRGDMDQCSFSFRAQKDTWGEQRCPDGSFIATRDLEDVDLFDVSAVTYPAYEDTEVHARAQRWADVVPLEVRSMIEGKEADAAVERRVYKSTSEVPDYVPEDKKAQWKEVWNSAYKKAKKDGKSNDDAESSAFAQANGVAGPKSEKNSEDKVSKKWEERTLESMEDLQAAISKALSEKYGNGPGCQWPLYWLCQTFEDYAIICGAEGKLFSIDWELDDDEEAVELGDTLTPVDIAYVEDRSSKLKSFVFRGSVPEKRASVECTCDCKACRAGNCDDCKAEDCDNPYCDCNNVDMDMPEDYQEDDADGVIDSWLEQNAAKLPAEWRAGKTKKVRTKRVAGKNLTKSAFAYVGDPNRTETWKLPIHDAAHVRNALARFDQTKGIPESAKAGVYRKIVAAAKKFGIQVSDEDKKRCLAVVPPDEIERQEMIERLSKIEL